MNEHHDKIVIKFEDNDTSTTSNPIQVSTAAPETTGFVIDTQAPAKIDELTEDLSIPFGHQNAMLDDVMPDFDFANPATDPVKLAHKLINIVRVKKALGISANQLGLPYRVFVMQSDPVFVCFNPVVTYYSDDGAVLDEACLSWPGVGVKIKRPVSIRVRFKDPYGNACTKQFTGMAARVFQHEFDHLNGIRYYDRAVPFHKERFKKNWKKVVRFIKNRAK
tara:strand:- start:1746 stop:2408 length:663 start_codon:yes stop_codon:yes gene_type:complete